MLTPSQPRFAIRTNPDDTLDAICLCCFLTVGTTMNESELPAIERVHQCDIGLLVARSQWARLSNELKGPRQRSRLELGDRSSHVAKSDGK